MNDLELAAYLDRRLAGRDQERIESHLAGCAECRNELLETKQLLRRSRRPRTIAIGSFLAAAAALILVVRPAMTPRSPAEAAAPMRAGQDAAMMVAYGPIGESSSVSPAFSWGANQRASTYRLTVTTGEGTTVWSVSTADTVVTLSDSVRLRQGERYLWVVDALLDDGTTRSTGFREFRVAP
jgi:hypothetical protein